VRASASAAEDGDDGDDSASSTSNQKEPPLGPRPLSSDDLILRRALELLKNPAKKAA
jgi:hypothetical protein